jgi:hypothetical protein
MTDFPASHRDLLDDQVATLAAIDATRVGAKYDADLAAYDAPEDERLVVTIDPVKIHPVDMS